jgi:glyoxylase-like metal-dependent hydrolase (beta-lactamase superfamily II)
LRAKRDQVLSNFQVERIVVGHLMTNSYILASGGECLILDPGDDAARILQKVSDSQMKPRYVISTHGHFDHLLAAGKVSRELGVPFCLHERDRDTLTEFWGLASRYGATGKPPVPDIYLKGDESWDIGGNRVYTIPTPGHTPGSISILAGSRLFTGDTLFNGSIGRTDIGGENHEMVASLRKIMSLPEHTEIFPGHGEPTEIGRELDTMRYFIRLLGT